MVNPAHAWLLCPGLPCLPGGLQSDLESGYFDMLMVTLDGMAPAAVDSAEEAAVLDGLYESCAQVCVTPRVTL